VPALPDLLVHIGEADGVLGHCTQLESVREHLVASVEFPIKESPVLPLGQRIDVEFRSSDIERSIHSEALTIRRTDEAARRLYGFRCDISKRVFLSLLNRRRLPRVLMLPADAPTVRLLDVADPAPVATLHDVSAMGLSIQLDAHLEPQLFERVHLELAVQLPGEPDPIRITAVIRHRKLVDSSVQYGLQVVAGIPELAPERKRFERYVADLLERAAAGVKGRRGTPH